MNDITLAMIVKNEARWLNDCLLSVQGLVNDIVIVDTGSTDNTINIARNHGARVYEHNWENDFSKARNLSLSYVQTPWVLVLDADERLSKSDHEVIRQLIQSQKADAYYLVQTTYSDKPDSIGWIPNNLEASEAQGYTGYTESSLVRLFKNDPLLKFDGVIHEHLRAQVEGKKVLVSDIRIHHYGQMVSSQVTEAKKKLYLDLGIQKCRDYPYNAHSWYELGAQYWIFGKKEESKTCLAKALSINPRHLKAHLAMALHYQENKQWKESINTYLKVMEIAPQDISPYLFLPNILADQAQFELAFHIIDLGDNIVKNHSLYESNKGTVYLKVGNYKRARDCFILACRLAPHNITAAFNLGVAYQKLGDHSQAITCFNAAIKEDSLKQNAYRLLAHSLFENAQFKQCEECLMAGLHLFPNDSVLRYQLIHLYFNTGRPIECQEQFKNFNNVNDLTEKERHTLSAMMDDMKGLTRDDKDKPCHHLGA
ncbi:tetratricopeptide repeat protein [bacterium]|nr:tetratricopeptide repeat protein [bacterium]